MVVTRRRAAASASNARSPPAAGWQVADEKKTDDPYTNGKSKADDFNDKSISGLVFSRSQLLVFYMYASVIMNIALAYMLVSKPISDQLKTFFSKETIEIANKDSLESPVWENYTVYQLRKYLQCDEYYDQESPLLADNLRCFRNWTKLSVLHCTSFWPNTPVVSLHYGVKTKLGVDRMQTAHC